MAASRLPAGSSMLNIDCPLLQLPTSAGLLAKIEFWDHPIEAKFRVLGSDVGLKSNSETDAKSGGSVCGDVDRVGGPLAYRKLAR